MKTYTLWEVFCTYTGYVGQGALLALLGFGGIEMLILTRHFPANTWDQFWVGFGVFFASAVATAFWVDMFKVFRAWAKTVEIHVPEGTKAKAATR